jgi:hypothetical protein
MLFGLRYDAPMNRILAFLLFALAFSAHAATYPVAPDLSKVGRGQLVPEARIEHIIAPREQALAKAAASLHAFTKATGYEGCAQICESTDGRLSLLLKTNFSQVGCMSMRADPVTVQPIYDCPAGFANRGERIHSHPEGERVKSHPEGLSIKANHVDAFWTKVRPGRRITVIPETFSKQDHKGGPGSYLVAKGRLLYLGAQGIVQMGVVGQSLVPRVEPAMLASVTAPVTCTAMICQAGTARFDGISLLTEWSVPAVAATWTPKFSWA